MQTEFGCAASLSLITEAELHSRSVAASKALRILLQKDARRYSDSVSMVMAGDENDVRVFVGFFLDAYIACFKTRDGGLLN